MTVALMAALGLVVGLAMPKVIALIPDRPAHDDEPAATPYRELAGWPRLPIVLAAATAIVFALITIARRDTPGDLPTYLVIGALGVAMTYIDLRERLLPDWLTMPALGVGVVGLAITAAATGEWGSYGRALLGTLVVGGFFLLLHLIRPADMGLGDVKLSLVVGLLLGWISWSAVVLGVFLAFLTGGVVGIVLIVAGRAGRRTALPFGPFIFAGLVLALLLTPAN